MLCIVDLVHRHKIMHLIIMLSLMFIILKLDMFLLSDQWVPIQWLIVGTRTSILHIMLCRIFNPQVLKNSERFLEKMHAWGGYFCLLVSCVFY